MPRKPRPVVAGQPIHITQRGNDRGAMFVVPDDHAYFREVLRVESERTRCAVHAYVLMTNHVHLLATPEEACGPARLMQAIGRRYVRYFNDRYDRTGTLWDGRYRSVLVDSSRYFLSCSQYIELNPVRAGLVAHPDDYPWSSFRRNAYGDPDPLLTTHGVYDALGPSPLARQAAYWAMFRAQMEESATHAVPHARVSGPTLGSTHLRAQIESLLQRRTARWGLTP